MNGLKQMVIIDKKTSLRVEGDYLVVESEKIHLNNIESIFISTTNDVSFSSLAVAKLFEREISIFFVDKKHAPYISMHYLYGSFESSSRVYNQIGWSDADKCSLLKHIITNKIKNQERTLTQFQLHSKEKLTKYLREYKGMDENNIEGVVAKLYFRTLFGNDFCRDTNSVINHQLNYGYALLAAEISRLIVSKGYLTQIGIKHHSATNKYNLTYDFIEPFRPIVDRYVSKKKITTFDFKEKCQMQNIFEENVMLNKKEYSLKDAINEYVINCFNYLNGNKCCYCEVSF